MTVLLRRRLMQASGGGEGDYSKQYLTFEFSNPGSIGISHGSKANNINVYYRLNGGAWTQYTLSTMMQVSAGDKIEWKGNNSAWAAGATTSTRLNRFSGTAYFQAYGNIMSILEGDNFKTATTFTTGYTMPSLFSGTSITSAENLVLPATTLTSQCYDSMFWQCTRLTTPPSELPATTLIASCYRNMFNGCSSLTSSQTLPALTLAGYCYYQMFSGCTALSYIKCLALTTGQQSTSNWVSGVASSGTFVKNANKNDWGRDTSGIPVNWTVQNATS